MARKKKPTSKKGRRRSGKKGRKKKAVDQRPDATAEAAAASPDVAQADDTPGTADAPTGDPSPNADPGASGAVDDHAVIGLDAEDDEPVVLGLDAEDDEPVVLDLDAEEDEPAVIDLDAEDDEPAVIDLDAEDDEPMDAIDRLIAETLAIAPHVEAAPEEDEPVIDLDADMHARAPVATATGEEDVSPEKPGDADAGARAVDTPEAAPPHALDLGPVSTPEVRDRLLAQTLAHAQHKDAQYRVPYVGLGSPRRRKLLIAAGLFAIAGVVAVSPPGWTRPDPPAQLGAADRARSLRAALALQAEQVEAFRARTRRLPATLDEVAAAFPGIRYVRSGNRSYQLVAYEPDGNAIVYDSASPSAARDSLRAAWLRAGRAP